MNTPAIPSAKASARTMAHVTAAFFVLLLTLHCQAWSPERTPVADARPLMISALKAADGQAQGVMRGELADAITQRFAATSPIFIDVTTEKRYRQPGCARLKVSFWQEGVRLPNAASAQSPRRQTVDFGINYCMDGLPPKSLQ